MREKPEPRTSLTTLPRGPEVSGFPPHRIWDYNRQSPEPTNYATGNRTRRDDRRWMMDDGQDPESGRQKNNSSFIPHPSSLFLLLFMFYMLFLSGCTKKDSIYRESRILMDTFCTITVISPSREKAREAVEAGFNRIKKIEHLLNYFSPESEITAVNRAAGNAPVQVSEETLDIIRKAVEIADSTNGAFDPTIGPLMKIWGFTSGTPAPDVPAENKIRDALRLVDYKKIKINISTSEIFLGEKNMEIDLGGIAKGYAADRAIETIQGRGIQAALVTIAGDIKGFGLKPNLQPWKVGIQHPRPAENTSIKEGEDIFASIFLEDKAISTSGDYQRFFIKTGKRYHHILNPKTGYPADGSISVSVIAPQGFMADALSTGIFILGPEKGIELLESIGLSGILVDSNRNVFITKDLERKIDIEKNI